MYAKLFEQLSKCIFAFININKVKKKNLFGWNVCVKLVSKSSPHTYVLPLASLWQPQSVLFVSKQTFAIFLTKQPLIKLLQTFNFCKFFTCELAFYSCFKKQKVFHKNKKSHYQEQRNHNVSFFSQPFISRTISIW